MRTLFADYVNENEENDDYYISLRQQRRQLLMYIRKN
jgi:hypothetical protein